jgi:dihydroflavonol-4-reductase
LAATVRAKPLASQWFYLNAANYQNLNACIVHPSGILGPEDHAISETTGTIIKIINGEMPIGISGSFNLCDVRDLAHGCVLAADKGKQGSCYILANGEVTLECLRNVGSKLQF